MSIRINKMHAAKTRKIIQNEIARWKLLFFEKNSAQPNCISKIKVGVWSTLEEDPP